MNFRSLSTLLTLIVIAALVITGSGCATPAGTAVAVTTGVLLGGGVAAQAATHSKVEVTVDIYEPASDDEALFQLGHQLAVFDVLNSSQPADALPTPAKIIRAEHNLESTVSQIQLGMAELNSASEQITALAPLPGGAHVVQNANLIAVQNDIAHLSKLLGAVISIATDFQSEADVIAGGDFTQDDLRQAGSTIRSLRKASRKLAAFRLSEAYIDLEKSQLRANISEALATSRPAEIPNVNDALTHAWNLMKIDPSMGAAKRMRAMLDAARRALRGDSQAIAVIDAMSKEGLGAMGQVAEASQLAVAAGYAGTAIALDGVTSSANLGPINNEVTQVLLSQGKVLSKITDESEANESRWHCFSHCVSEGGPGNNDTVFYMENQAMPVLKSASFDPTKFIAADGAIYKEALAALANVATQKASGAGKNAGSDTSGGADQGAGDTGGNSDATGDSNADTTPAPGSGDGASSPGSGDGSDGGSTDAGASASRRIPAAQPIVIPSDFDSPASSSSPASSPVTLPVPPPEDPNAPAAPKPVVPKTKTSSADAIKAAKDQIAAVRKTKLAALRKILDQQQAVKSAALAGDQTKWKDAATQATTIKAVKDALSAAVDELRTAAKSAAQ